MERRGGMLRISSATCWCVSCSGSAPAKITAARLVTVPNGGMSSTRISQRSICSSGFVRAACLAGSLVISSVVNGRVIRRFCTQEPRLKKAGQSFQLAQKPERAALRKLREACAHWDLRSPFCLQRLMFLQKNEMVFLPFWVLGAQTSACALRRKLLCRSRGSSARTCS